MEGEVIEGRGDWRESGVEGEGSGGREEWRERVVEGERSGGRGEWRERGVEGEGSGGRGDWRERGVEGEGIQERELEGASQGENRAENEVMLVRRYRPATSLCAYQS